MNNTADVYAKMSKNPRVFRRSTGMSLPQFDSFLCDAEKAYQKAEEERLERPDRKRKRGGGRKFALSFRDMVLMTLMYCRTYTTQDALTLIFKISQPSISANVNRIARVLKMALPTPQQIYERAKKADTVKKMAEIFPDLVALTDAAEQPILRPQRSDMEKSHYSGKKRDHTVKSQYTTSTDGLIVHAPPHSPGRRNDFGIYKMKHPVFHTRLKSGGGESSGPPARDRLLHYADTAYGAMDKVVQGIDFTTPYRREPRKDLTPEQREFNRVHSRIRVRVENAIRRVKIFRITKDRYRNRLGKRDLFHSIVCGIVNHGILRARQGLA